MEKLEERYIQLSKYLSYLLRHDPDQGDLSLDQRGFASIHDLLDALEGTKHSWACRDDIERLIDESGRTRFEIRDDKIRALYGHSLDVVIEDEIEPSSELYHGTSPGNLEVIMNDGLKPMGRQYVHLTKSIQEGEEIGRRHHPDPVVLKVDAESAGKDGIKFYDRGDVILSEEIPPKYIEVMSDKDSP